MNRMFHLVNRTWNPITGCLHYCKYCWARLFAETRLKKTTKKYADGFKPKFHEVELKRKFRPGEFVFVCDMGDMFGDWVPDEWILKVFKIIRKFPATEFLLLTKNPLRYVELLERYGASIFSHNMVFDTTIETLDDNLYVSYNISRALPPNLRLHGLCIFVDKMTKVGRKPKTFISIEPILLYWSLTDIEVLAKMVANQIKPIAIYIGYDNYGFTKKLKIPEPSLKTTKQLINTLKQYGLNVYTKTLRKAWWETTK